MASKSKVISSVPDVVAHLKSLLVGDEQKDASLHACIEVCKHVKAENKELHDAVVRTQKRLGICLDKLATRATRKGSK